MRLKLFREAPEWIRWDTRTGAIPAQWFGLRGFLGLTSRDRGEAVRSARSSWVRRFDHEGETLFAKTYDYPEIRDRRRGIGRNTAWARSRAAREWDAAAFLAEHFGDSSRALGVAELRRGPLLRRAVLLTREVPGTALDALWPRLAEEERRDLESALWDRVAAWHGKGYRDRNLDPRNLIVRRHGEGWQIVKIDAPRFRLVPPGRPDDRLAKADRERLARGLRELGNRERKLGRR